MNRSSLSSPLPWLIFAIAAGTRLSGLDLDGLDHDELWTANLLLQPIGDQLYALWRDTHPPLPHLLPLPRQTLGRRRRRRAMPTATPRSTT